MDGRVFPRYTSSAAVQTLRPCTWTGCAGVRTNRVETENGRPLTEPTALQGDGPASFEPSADPAPSTGCTICPTFPSPMALSHDPVAYEDLNSAQQENYNYHKVSARLADFGYTTIRLYDDFGGADFIAKHADDSRLHKVQLKGRLTFAKKYERRDSDEQIYVAFPDGNDWYVYPHDDVLDRFMHELSIIADTLSWSERGSYHIGSPTDEQRAILAPHRLPHLDSGALRTGD